MFEGSVRRDDTVDAFEAELQRLRAAFPAERIHEELVALERERRRLEDRIASLRAKLEIWRSLEPASSNESGPRRLPTKRDAVHALLRGHRGPATLAEMREELLARGWMADSPASRHALEVAVATMAKRGELLRVRRGVYLAARQDRALGDAA